jgi:MipA family protein
MDRRRDSGDGVINAEWRTRSSFIHVSYNRDLGNASDGDSATLILARNLYYNQVVFHHDFVLVPSIRFDWLSSKLVDYYYGVRPTESVPGRHVYTGRETVKLGAQLTGFLRMSDTTALFAGCHAEHFGSGITDSPIVVYHSNTIRGYFGAAWRF